MFFSWETSFRPWGLLSYKKSLGALERILTLILSTEEFSNDYKILASIISFQIDTATIQISWWRCYMHYSWPPLKFFKSDNVCSWNSWLKVSQLDVKCWRIWKIQIMVVHFYQKMENINIKFHLFSMILKNSQSQATFYQWIETFNCSVAYVGLKDFS